MLGEIGRRWDPNKQLLQMISLLGDESQNRSSSSSSAPKRSSLSFSFFLAAAFFFADEEDDEGYEWLEFGDKNWFREGEDDNWTLWEN